MIIKKQDLFFAIAIAALITVYVGWVAQQPSKGSAGTAISRRPTVVGDYQQPTYLQYALEQIKLREEAEHQHFMDSIRPADQLLADYLYENYEIDCKDDAFTIALYLRKDDTTESETIKRYRNLIAQIQKENP